MLISSSPSESKEYDFFGIKSNGIVKSKVIEMILIIVSSVNNLYINQYQHIKNR